MTDALQISNSVYFSNTLLLEQKKPSTLINLSSTTPLALDDKVYVVLDRTSNEIFNADILTFADFSLETSGTFDSEIYIVGTKIKLLSASTGSINVGNSAEIIAVSASKLTFDHITSTFVDEIIDTSTNSLTFEVITQVDRCTKVSSFAPISSSYPKTVGTGGDFATIDDAITAEVCYIVIIENTSVSVSTDLAARPMTIYIPCNLVLEMTGSGQFINSPQLVFLGEGEADASGAGSFVDATVSEFIVKSIKINMLNAGDVAAPPAVSQKYYDCTINQASISGGVSMGTDDSILSNVVFMSEAGTGTDILETSGNIRANNVVFDLPFASGIIGDTAMTIDGGIFNNITIPLLFGQSGDTLLMMTSGIFNNCTFGNCDVQIGPGGSGSEVQLNNCSKLLVRFVGGTKNKLNDCSIETLLIAGSPSSLEICGCRITDAIFGTAGLAVDIENMVFTDCYINSFAFDASTAMTIDGLTFIGCSSTGGSITIPSIGVAISSINNLNIIDSDIAGGIAVNLNASAPMSNSVIKYNSCIEITITCSAISTVSNVNISYNNITGATADLEFSGELVMDKCIIGNNNVDGAAILFTDVNAITNVLVSQNTADTLTMTCTGTLSGGSQILDTMVCNNTFAATVPTTSSITSTLADVSVTDQVQRLIVDGNSFNTFSEEFSTTGGIVAPALGVSGIITKNNHIDTGGITITNHERDINNLIVSSNYITTLIEFDLTETGGTILPCKGAIINGNYNVASIRFSSTNAGTIADLYKNIHVCSNIFQIAAINSTITVIGNTTLLNFTCQGNIINTSSSLSGKLSMGSLNKLSNAHIADNIFNDTGTPSIFLNATANGALVLQNNVGIFTNIVDGVAGGNFTPIRPQIVAPASYLLSDYNL